MRRAISTSFVLCPHAATATENGKAEWATPAGLTLMKRLSVSCLGSSRGFNHPPISVLRDEENLRTKNTAPFSSIVDCGGLFV
jgi:hypothetical protein